MYMMIAIGLAIVIFMVAAIFWGLGDITMLFDTPSLLLLLIIGISVLLASGLGKDFLAAFSIALGRQKRAGLRERKRAAEAVELFAEAVRYGSVFGIVLQFICFHNIIGEDGKWLIHLSVLFLLPLYAYAMNLLLLPIKSRLQLGIIECMQQPEKDSGADDGEENWQGREEEAVKGRSTQGKAEAKEAVMAGRERQGASKGKGEKGTEDEEGKRGTEEESVKEGKRGTQEEAVREETAEEEKPEEIYGSGK